MRGLWIAGKELITRKAFWDDNPATQERFEKICAGSRAHVRRALELAQTAFERWAAQPVAKRAAVLAAAARLLRAQKSTLAALITAEMGKPIVEAETEVERAAQTLEYYSRQSRALLPERTAAGTVLRQPWGTVGIIKPWNYPLLLPVRSIAPALLAGNTAIFKPASCTPLVGLELGPLLAAAGLPAGVLNIIPGSAAEVGDEIVSNPAIPKLSFTGSTASGRAIAARAGIKHLTLELGGKSALIVDSSANIPAAAAAAVHAAFRNCGQVCTAAARIILHTRIYDRFARAFVAAARQLRIGDPTERTTQLGPLASAEQFAKVRRYIRAGLREGAKLLTGGRALGGYYFQPTIFAGDNDMRIAREEIFGPVVVLIRARSLGAALELANASSYGLAAGIFAAPRLARVAAAKLEAGNVYINRSTIGAVLELPFGGIKGSGYGRELGIAALHEFTWTKAIVGG